MGTLYVDTLEPEGGTTTLTVGESGQDTVVGGNTIKLNTLKDAGGNTLFVSDGSGTLSSVNSGFGSAMVLLSTTTVSSAVATINFTSNITSTYGEYIFKFYNINPATDGTNFTFQTSTDGGPSYGMTATTTFFRARHKEDNASASLDYRGGEDQAQSTDYIKMTLAVGNGADESLAGELHLFNPASTTYVKHFYSRINFYELANQTADAFVGGYINSTDDVDAISFKMSSGNINAGTIKMFGIK